MPAHDHDRPLAAGRAGSDATPAELPYRSDILAALSAVNNRATSPDFQNRLAAHAGLAIDPSAANVLRHLGFRGTLRPSELAEEMGTGRSNVSKILRRLETAGLVSRAPDLSDSRANVVTLTDAGAQAARATFEIGDRMIRDLTAGWTEPELRSYEELTLRLAAAMAAYPKEDAGT